MHDRDPDLSTTSWLVAGGRPVEPGNPLNAPIVPASNFLLDDGGAGTSYARGDSTATWAALEVLLGGLESATALSFASGMAAISSVFDLLPAGVHVAVPADCYQGVAGVVDEGVAAGRWTAERVATDDTDSWVAAAAAADLMWVESPSNPLLLVADLVGIGAATRKPGGLLAVDNTFATALNQQPLDLGADIAVQSTTKFIGGHSDLLGGVATTRNPELAARLDRNRTLRGATPGALEAFLALRGARTMALRLERSQQSAGVLAERLSGHPAVEHVRYPGLPGDPGHALASEQLGGFGSIVSFVVAGGGAAADAACSNVRLICHATSLGGVESTMERRAAVAGQEHLPPGLVRLSVGIEAVDDLWADLDQALA
ncbi:MAG: trans-sulfuration enzyme family protein [Ilumatobacteraceae bacterium]